MADGVTTADQRLLRIVASSFTLLRWQVALRQQTMQLYETHLPVKSTEAALQFYVDVVQLQFAYRDPTRDIVFLWIGSDRRSMLGLWGPSTTYGGDYHKCHFAIAVTLPELHGSAKRLVEMGVPCRNFQGETTTEPSVIGWMPSAQIYFRDLDGHSVEFIALLNEAPDAGFIGSLSDWEKKARQSGTGARV